MHAAMPKEILVIDDEESIRFTFSYLLEDQGYAVEVAASPDEALEKLARKSYALIFLDLLLGTHSGITILKEIKKSNPETPVIMVTGAPDSDSVSQALSMGAFAYIPKPVRLETLVTVTEKALNFRAGDQHPINGKLHKQ